MWVGSDPGSGAINLGHASLHRLIPGQTSWQKSSNGFPIGDTGNQADDIAYDSSAGIYYAGAALGGAFVSSDGLNWQQRTTGLGGLGLPTSVVAFNGMAFELRPLTTVHKTMNQGTNWTALASHQGVSSGYLLEKGARIMFASSGNNTLQDGFNYSDDNGATWTFLTGLRGTADLSLRDGLIYAAGMFGGTRTFELGGADGAVTFRTREDFHGWLAWLIVRTMPDLQPSFDEFAASLKRAAEAR